MTPIIRPDDGPFILALHPLLPVRTVKDLVSLAKARPAQIEIANWAKVAERAGLKVQ